jgi:hypothetical protein
MFYCKYDLRAGGRGCQQERALDYDFCLEHMDTPRGFQHAKDVIQRKQLTLPSQVQQAIDKAKEIPEDDYHTSALEQMANTLEVIQQWVEESRRHLDTVPQDQRRYKDKGGQEQLRSEVAIYERALLMISKHLGAMSKISLQDKIVSLGKAQVDMMIRMIMTVVEELRLDAERKSEAQALLLDILERDANLTSRVENYAQKQLNPSAPPTVVDATMPGMAYHAQSGQVRP